MWSYRQEAPSMKPSPTKFWTISSRLWQPRYMRLKAKWWVRGGIYTTVVVEHRKEGWVPVAPVELPEFETNDPTRG